MKKPVRRMAWILTAALTLGACPSFSGALKVQAVTTQEQIQQTDQEREELQGQLGRQQENIDGLKGQKRSLQGELKSLNSQLTEVSENLDDLEYRIAKMADKIEQTQALLDEMALQEEKQYADMVSRVQNMYESNSNSGHYVNRIFSAGNFGEILNAADWFEKIADYDQKKLEEFKETRKRVEETKESLELEMVELDNLKVAAEAEKNKVSGLISKTANSISEYADQIQDAERIALEYEAELKKKEEDLEYLRKKLREELAMSQAASHGNWRSISEVTFAEGDRKLLANLIYCEAGAEPYEGQVAVGSVVINRVLSGNFPDTVVGVIYQKGQFTPVGSGRLELALASDKATADCYKAADLAMSGYTNVGACVFFRTPVEGLTGLQIGGHIFY